MRYVHSAESKNSPPTAACHFPSFADARIMVSSGLEPLQEEMAGQRYLCPKRTT
jgi:hypothetical protein